MTEHTIFDHKWRLVFNKSETPESDSTILTKEHFSEIQPMLHEVSFDTLERTNSSEAPKATIFIPDSEPKKMEKVASGFIWNSASLGGNLVMTQRNHFPSGIISPLAYSISIIRDALDKIVYSRLFDWTVDKINNFIGQDSDSKVLIEVLDIYGFESFKTSSFEQF